MIECRITNWMYEKAKELAMIDKAKYGSDKNTILDIVSDNTRLTGKIGEVVASCYFNIELSDKKDYDIIINQERVEIKSKKVNCKPKPNYLCSIFNQSIDFDRYIFVFVHSSYTKAWIVGTCTKDEFEDNSFYGCPLIKGRKSQPSLLIYIKDLEDVESWQSKFGRTVGAYGLMRRQADS